MTYRLGLAALAIAALTACGGDICDRGQASADECDLVYTDTELEQCKTALDSCTKDDIKLMNAYTDCIEDAGLLECDYAGDGAAFLTCALDLAPTEADPDAGLSVACLAAQSGGTTATFSTGLTGTY